MLDNRGDQDDTLTGAIERARQRRSLMRYLIGQRIMPLQHASTCRRRHRPAFAPDTVIIRLSDLAQPPGDAFPLTLTFAVRQDADGRRAGR